MRVLIVNTSENTGGAAVAANRIMEALNNNGVKAKMLVRDKATDDLTVVGLGGGLRQKWNFLWERWCIFCHAGFSRRHLFDIDIANAGTDITKTREFKEADVIHLNWVNQGMLSLKGISRILASGKPVVRPRPCATLRSTAASMPRRAARSAPCCRAAASWATLPRAYGSAR